MTNRKCYQDAPGYCHNFFDLVQTEDIAAELESSKQSTLQVFAGLTPGQEEFAYAPGKWTLKQVLRHIIDCERVYAYRAFRFSRHDHTVLSAFDELAYAAMIPSAALQVPGLLIEYLATRAASIALFETMTDDMLDFRGKVNANGFTARTLGFLMAGHNLHHISMIKAKYR